MLKTMISGLLPLLMLLSNGTGQLLTGLNRNGSDPSVSGLKQSVPQGNTGTLEKMIVASGSVAMELNWNRLNGTGPAATASRPSVLRFSVEPNSFFTVLVFNNELRGPLPSSMRIIPQNSVTLPGKLSASFQQLVVENMAWGETSDLVIRDGKTGFVFFNIEGQEYQYDPNQRVFNVQMGRLLISKEFATELGRPSEAGAIVGQLAITAIMRPIEVTQIVEGEVSSSSMPSISPESGTNPGPDVIVGDLNGLAQFGLSSGTQVGLAVGTDSCNAGVVNLNWKANPDNDHPVIPQNLYRMSGGATNDERFEQIGQSQVKHAFTALTNNLCGFGCNGTGGSALGSGCSDPYSASLNAGTQNALGSRAWINPFTGAYPRGDSATPNNQHTAHSHPGPSHRILTEISDLVPAQNPGATYYAESQYVTPHEYAWCQVHPSECNMYNNVSYRRYNVTNSTSPFTFSAVGSTERMKVALNAWTGATLAQIQPDVANDGIGFVAYKVTNPSPGVWHYEYAIFNQNLDRAIQSFSVPVGGGVTLTNVGFHAPPQHPGWTFDGTAGNTGYSSVAWAQSQAGGAMTWNSETFAQNQNANAIRWGTTYNFRFDSNRPPTTANATVGFFKAGSPITVQIQAPSSPTGPFSVTGRVATAGGRGVFPARVSLTDSGNVTRYTITNPYGSYRFTDIVTGGMYTIEVFSKLYIIDPQTLPVNDNLANVDFLAQPRPIPIEAGRMPSVQQFSIRRIWQTDVMER